MRRVLGLSVLVRAAACADPESEDGGLTVLDVGSAPDAGAALDAEPIDLGAPDLGAADLGVVDTGVADLGVADTGVDAGFDAGVDAGFDAGAGMDATTSTSAWSAGDGLPDQACPAWTLVDSATPEDPSLSAGVFTIATSQVAENMYYYQEIGELIVPPQLVLEARIRYVSGSETTPSRANANIGFRLGNDRIKNILFIDDGEIFILSAENTRGPSVSLPTSDAFHTYRIEADIVVGGVVEVFRDGVSVLTGVTFADPDTSALPVLYFGEASLFALGVSEWTNIRHNAHAPVVCP